MGVLKRCEVFLMVRRNKYLKRGRPRKKHTVPLGGIPMKVKNGRVMYAGKSIPMNNTTEEVQRGKAVLPSGEGNFIRRHIYEMRFGILDETYEERRKREYKEWWDRQ
jgi:hypothetical protein